MSNYNESEFSSKNIHLSKKEIRLFEACINNDINSINKLLKNGIISKSADVNAKAHYFLKTPLQAAIYYSNKSIIEILISNGADVNYGNDDKDYGGPLTLAIKHRSKDIVQFLINKGADVNAKTTYGGTPLSKAIEEGKKDITDLLVSNGAHYDIVDLFSAIFHQKKDIVEFLISKGLDVNEEDFNGRTPIFYALEHSQFNESNEVLELLVSKGANINVKNEHGQTPLDLALEDNMNDTARFLISKGAHHKAECKTSSHLFSKWTSCDNTKHMRYCLICNLHEESTHIFKIGHCVDFPYCDDDCSKNYYCEVCRYIE